MVVRCCWLFGYYAVVLGYWYGLLVLFVWVGCLACDFVYLVILRGCFCVGC